MPENGEDALSKKRRESVERIFHGALPVSTASLAHKYLVGKRRCWPPNEPLPPDVRVIDATTTPILKFLPQGTVECLVYGFRDESGAVGAVQMEALSSECERLTNWQAGDKIKRFTRGAIGQCCFEVAGDRAGIVGIAEGPTTAMAASKHQGITVRASAGAMMLPEHLFLDATKLVVFTDKDRAGFARAFGILRESRVRGVRVNVAIAEDGDWEDEVVAELNSICEKRGVEFDQAWDVILERAGATN